MYIRVFLLFSVIFSCQVIQVTAQRVRVLADTIGFSHTARQMDSVMNRIQRLQKKELLKYPVGINEKTSWRIAICPHDDYTYVGSLYPQVLRHVKAKTVILFGVAHKAKKYQLENQLLFESYDYWEGPYGKIKVSFLRNELIAKLPPPIFQIHDTIQTVEHSIEALLPFIQFYNQQVEIIPILIPATSFERMNELAIPLAESIKQVMEQHQLQWGKDIALVISTDAVHYGDEDWSGRNFARYGADSAGYGKALTFEYQLMNECLLDRVAAEKVKAFTEQTTQKENFREYNWTWCGRYSVPFGLLTGFYLQGILQAKPLKGILVGYSNSLDHIHIPVKDLGMGITAPANIRHWVGYAGIGYE